MALPRHRVRHVLVALGAVACTSCAPKPPAAAAPLDWCPRLDPPIRQLEEVLAATDQQQPRNYTSANLAFVLDAKLYLLFDRYVASLPAAERPAAVDGQRRWLDERKRAAAEAYGEYEGGTLASFAGSRAFIDATKARIAEIERRLAPPAAPPPPADPPAARAGASDFDDRTRRYADTIGVAARAGVDYPEVVRRALRRDPESLHTLFRLTADAGFDAASSDGHAAVLGTLLRHLGDAAVGAALAAEPESTRTPVLDMLRHDFGVDAGVKEAWLTEWYPLTFKPPAGR